MTHASDLSITPSGDATGMAHVAVPGAIDISHGPILYVEGVSVSFDGFKALNDLSFTLDAGELRCIIGPNGAGKTTMMDVITGKTGANRCRRCSRASVCASAPTSWRACCRTARNSGSRSACC